MKNSNSLEDLQDRSEILRFLAEEERALPEYLRDVGDTIKGRKRNKVLEAQGLVADQALRRHQRAGTFVTEDQPRCWRMKYVHL